jgi:dolichyl-phosphate beta-glucosyltransferase
VDGQPAPFLSIVIPAYNEESRLPSTLEAVRGFLASKPYTSEIILADDGSEDRTAEIATAFATQIPCLRVLRLEHRGKAHTVRDGILTATGQFVMFTDADLSTPIHFADRLLSELERGADIAIGSREGEGAQRHEEPAYRHLMGRVFNTVVRLLAVPGINDTQCGFKAFKAAVAHDIFSSARLYDKDRTITGPRVTGFDVEILFVARKHGYRIVEVPVEWTHVSGSKVAPVSDSVRMFADVVRVRYNAIRGRYSSSSERGQ